jgi:hypothetical protein
MNPEVETVVATGKFVSIMDHVRNNRIEYLLAIGLAHLLGLTSKAYGHVSGVCI